MATIKFNAGIETQSITTKGAGSSGVDINSNGDITISGNTGKFTGPIAYYDKTNKSYSKGLKIVCLKISDYEKLITKEADTLYLCTTEE